MVVNVIKREIIRYLGRVCNLICEVWYIFKFI